MAGVAVKVDVARWSVVSHVSGKAIGIGGAEGEFAKGGLGLLSASGGVVALFTQLARPSKKVYCTVPRGNIPAHTASSAEWMSPCRNWTLSRTEVDVS